MNAFRINFIQLVNIQDRNTNFDKIVKFLSRHLFLILVLLWTPFILIQTWNIQHSCSPLVNWGGDRCPIESVSVSPKELKLNVGKSQYLKIDIKFKTKNKNKKPIEKIQWTSSNEKIATVSANGQVSAVAPGLAKITAVSKKDKTKSDSVNLLVEGIANLELESKSFALGLGQTRKLAYSMNGFGNFSQDVNWSSENKEIATVDKDGVVKAVALGETNITAFSKQDINKKSITKLTVSDNISVKRVIIDILEKDTTFRVGEIRTLVSTVEGVGISSEDVSWSSTNPNLVTITGQGHTAKVEAVSIGKVTIIAISHQDKSKKGEIQLEFLPPIVNYIAVQPKQIELDVNSTAELCSIVKGIGAIDKNINWSSSNDQIATVDNDGIVTAVSKGEVQITATSKQNPEKSAITKLKIPRGINWIAISTASIVTAGATLVGVPLPAAIALGSMTATGIHNWQTVIPIFCN